MASISRILIVLCVCAVASQAQRYEQNNYNPPQYSPQYPQCQFSSSCTEISFHGNIMYANCRTIAGEVVRSSIDVNQCVGVDDHGRLDCSANFVHSCSDVAFNGITMAARCDVEHGYKVFSNRALDECIGNHNGRLTCC